MVGYTPSVSAAVWVGSDGDKALRGPTGAPLFGSTLAGPIWDRFMQLYLSGKPGERFDRVAAISSPQDRVQVQVQQPQQHRTSRTSRTSARNSGSSPGTRNRQQRQNSWTSSASSSSGCRSCRTSSGGPKEAVTSALGDTGVTARSGGQSLMTVPSTPERCAASITRRASTDDSGSTGKSPSPRSASRTWA